MHGCQHLSHNFTQELTLGISEVPSPPILATRALSPASSITTLDADDIVLGERIGKGATGTVYRAVYKKGSANEPVAVKKLLSRHINPFVPFITALPL